MASQPSSNAQFWISGGEDPDDDDDDEGGDAKAGSAYCAWGPPPWISKSTKPPDYDLSQCGCRRKLSASEPAAAGCCSIRGQLTCSRSKACMCGLTDEEASKYDKNPLTMAATLMPPVQVSALARWTQTEGSQPSNRCFPTPDHGLHIDFASHLLLTSQASLYLISQKYFVWLRVKKPLGEAFPAQDQLLAETAFETLHKWWYAECTCAADTLDPFGLRTVVPESKPDSRPDSKLGKRVKGGKGKVGGGDNSSADLLNSLPRGGIGGGDNLSTDLLNSLPRAAPRGSSSGGGS